ncbi:MAG: Asp-tRNA(Asn) amidotransferase subunit GatC [Methanobrevibacter sp.]|nr:Asp-tRNA(Asn) amidotransferase subunit GatC [Methanobrevibacter sp.]
MEIKEDAEKIVEEFSEKLADIPDLEETWYITDNLNLTRTDIAHKKNSEKILRNARIDKDGNLIVKKADWI